MIAKGKGHLYNLKTGEVLTVEYSRSITGHGKLSAIYASGEKVTGEYSIVRGGGTAWGNVYTSVYGVGGYASGSGQSFANYTSRTARGSAILTGDHKVMECEFVMGEMHGSGACRNQDGEIFKLIF